MKKISVLKKNIQKKKTINERQNIDVRENNKKLDKDLEEFNEKDNKDFNEEEILKARRKRREESYRDLREKICQGNKSSDMKALEIELEKLNENREEIKPIKFSYLETINLVELLIAKINSDFFNYTNYDESQQSHCVEKWRRILKEVLDRIDNVACELLTYVNHESIHKSVVATSDYKEYKMVTANLREIYRGLNHFNEISNTHDCEKINEWLNEFKIKKIEF